ncbi:hypothetical protein SVAN01_03205 [Stagonosporopsis vannaccii]|nr:hypothetical protein SVAN01_03205 [Stagonosporopsis vannaccii]
MESNASPHNWSINMPKNLLTLRQKDLETTPSKHKASSLSHHIPADARTHSAPNLLPTKQPASEPFGIPDQLGPRKRAKTASGPSSGVSDANSNNEVVSPGPKTPGSCKKNTDHYITEFWHKRHIDTCQDPTCKDSVKSSLKIQDKKVEEVFTTIPTKKQAAPLEASSRANAQSDKDSASTKAGGDPDAKKFESTGEPHEETPGVEESDNLEPGDSDEAQSDLDESILDDVTVSSYDKSPLKMHSRLQTKFEQRLSPKDEPGYIYVMQDTSRPHLCKIGKSKDPKVRLNSMKRKCGLELEIVHYKTVNLYTKTEVLVKAYLSDLCKPYKCEICGQKHGEWFEISSDLAKAAVDKWVNFMRHESPYDPRSKDLLSCWAEWLRLYDFTFADADVDSLRVQWDKFMSRSELDHLNFRVQSFWDILWKFFWPVYATIAWTATFIACRHPVVFLLMGTSVIGTFVSMSHDFRLPRHATTMPNRRRTK